MSTGVRILMLFIVLLAMLHLCCGWTIAVRIPISRRLSDYLAASAIIAFAGFYLLPIVMGWLTGIMTVGLNIYCSALMMVCASLFLQYRYCKTYFDFREATTTLFHAGEWPWLATIPIVALWGTELMLGSVLPVRAWDAAAVHIGPAMEWFSTGRFDLTMFGGKNFSSQVAQWFDYPNIKAVFPWLLMEQTHQTAGTALTQWPWQILLATTLFTIARRCGVNRAAGLLAVFFTVSVPEVILQSMEAYCDVVFLATISGIIWTTLILASRVPTTGTMFLTVIAWGLLAGAKNNAVLAGAVFGPVILGILLYNLPKGRKSRAAVLPVLIVMICWLVSGSWFLRGIRLFNNPLYPYTVNIGGWDVFKGPDTTKITLDMMSHYVGVPATDIRWFSLMGWNPTVILADWCGGFGLHFPLLGLSAILIMLGFGLIRSSGARAMNGRPTAVRGRVSQDVIARRLMVLMLILWYFACPANMNTRYVLSNLIVASVAFAWILTHAPTLLRAALTVALLATAAFNCFIAIPSYYYRPFAFEKLTYDFLTQDEMTATDQTLPNAVTPMEVWKLSIAKPGCKLAMPDTKTWCPWLAFVPRKGVQYCFAPVCSGTGEEAATQWHRELKKLGATHLYLPAENPDWYKALLARNLFTPIFSTRSSTIGTPSGNLYVNLDKQEQGTLFEIKRENNQ